MEALAMLSTPVCPDITQYKKLATGQLSSPDKEALLDHLERCHACVQRVESLSERDTLVDLIRQARTLGDGPAAAEAVARLIERLRKLRPSAEAAEKAPAQIRLVCSGCGKSLKVTAGLGGKKVKCPHCQTMIPVPTARPPTGEESPQSPGPAMEDALALAPRRSAGGRSAAVTASGAGQSQPVSADQHLYDFLAPAQSPDELGRLGPYRVLRVLGAGGMGVVFQAEDPHLQRLVALKAILPGLAASDSAKQRFLREARAAAALKHDHIVTIHQVGEDRGAPFLAMEFLEGEPLDDRLKREGKLPLEDVLRIGREIAEGLAAAHERGLIHRDIKPANVWLECKKGRVKILDFGLARAADDEAHLTQSGAFVGTPAYMAPEQAQGKNVNPRSDLFSLGCVLYRMATGEAPFRGTDMISTLMAVATEHPRAPVTVNAELPRALSDLIMRLLEKDPACRPSSANEVVEALQTVEKQLGRQEAATDRLPGSIAPPRRRRLALVGAAVLLLGGMIGGGVYFTLIHIAHRQGDYVIDTDDPDFAFAVAKDGGVTLEDRKTNRKFKLNVLRQENGEFELEVTDPAADLSFQTKSFTIKRGDKVALKAWFQRKQDAVAKATPVADPWINEVAAFRPDKQVAAVVARLKELNPGFDGKETHRIGAGAVTELSFLTDYVTDISPVGALNGLQVLHCRTAGGKGTFSDLCPLKDLKLTGLDCQGTRVSELSALKDMKLTSLNCAFTLVSDLSPLKDMKLTTLYCRDTKVTDLSPLKDMKLTFLDCSYTLVSDLSPLKDMKLKGLGVAGTQVSDLSPLKDMKLTELNCAATQVTDLSSLKDMKLTTLHCPDTKVTDLSPLKDTKLTWVNLARTKVSDLSPLKDMKLTYLECAGTEVTDLSSLKAMPLKTLEFDFKPEGDASILRSIKTLETINNKPAAAFWKEVDEKKPK
jgi:LSD1 subclass zinc finger protein